MLDDVALAKFFKRNGRRVGFRLAPDFLSVRLYKSNHHAFWGMTKNILEGLGGRFWLAPAVILLPIFVFWTPPYCALAGAFEGDLLLVAVAAGTYALQYASIWFARHFFEIQPAKAIFFPLVAIPVFCCMARASTCIRCTARSSGEAERSAYEACDHRIEALTDRKLKIRSPEVPLSRCSLSLQSYLRTSKTSPRTGLSKLGVI